MPARRVLVPLPGLDRAVVALAVPLGQERRLPAARRADDDGQRQLVGRDQAVYQRRARHQGGVHADAHAHRLGGDQLGHEDRLFKGRRL